MEYSSVGSTLTFSYSTGHNVYSMPSAADFNSCNFGGATLLATSGPYVHTFTSEGTFYFACQVSGHCDAGQKVTVNVAP